MMMTMSMIILGGFATSADPVQDLPGTSGEAFWEVRQSPPGSSPWDLGGGGVGVPGESQGGLKMESKYRLKLDSPRTSKNLILIRS